MTTQKKVEIPAGYTEEEVVAILTKISTRLAAKFRFGYHAIEDIKQQAILEGLKGLAKYDGIRPLENFLWIHIRNRLFNYKRDNYERIDKPCERCPIAMYDKSKKLCMAHPEEELENCKWYYSWIMRNLAKRNLVDAIDFDNVDDEGESSMSSYTDFAEDIDKKVIFELLDEHMPMEYYEDYRRYKYGTRLSKVRKDNVKGIIVEILTKHGYL